MPLRTPQLRPKAHGTTVQPGEACRAPGQPEPLLLPGTARTTGQGPLRFTPSFPIIRSV